ncbi:MAG: helix-turn-helix transcriptional regulator [Isosphaeraceae bacterium]
MSTEPFSDQLRRAISQSGLSHYAICQSTGINKANLSRFMNCKRGLSLENIDKIVSVLNLRLEASKKPRQPKPGTDRP